MAGFPFPFTVEVVSHQVDEVQVGPNGGDVVATFDVVGAYGDGGG